MRKTITFALFLFILAGCGANDKVVYLKFVKIDGLTSNHPLLLNGMEIGDIIDVQVENETFFLVTIQLPESLQLAKDSQFTIMQTDLFNKAIVIEEGKSKINIHDSDTLIGTAIIDILPQVSCGSGPTLRDKINKLVQNK